MKIIRGRIQWFKALKALEFSPSGANMLVSADNGVGKTTLFDSFTWCLFGKDSLGNTMGPSVKPFDPITGDVRHRLTTSVEYEFLMDSGKTLTLRRDYSETWQAKKGSSNKEMTGHTFDCFVNNVPKTITEFQNYVNGICREDTFKQLTNPFEFNERLPWRKRREALIEFAGDVSSAEVIASNPELEELSDLRAGDMTVADCLKVLNHQKKPLAEQIERTPHLINEAEIAKKAVPFSVEIYSTKLATKQAEADKIRKEIADAEAGSPTATLERQVSELESSQKLLANQIASRVDDSARNAALAEQRKLTGMVAVASEQATTAARMKTNANDHLENIKLKRANIQAEVVKIDADDWAPDGTCPTCGNALGKAALDKAIETHNAANAEKRKALIDQGKATCSVDMLKKAQAALESAIAEETQTANKLAELKSQLAAIVVPAEATAPDPMSDGTYATGAKSLEALKARLEKAKADPQTAVQAMKHTLATVEKDIEDARAGLADIKSNQTQVERITKLEADLKLAATQIEILEKKIWLLGQYTVAYCNLITDRVNGMFEITKFKLFNVQLNGGIEETCVATVGGIAFDDGLNHAAKVNCGLDVINTLAKRYEFAPPIFIDGKESVTRPLPTVGQQIQLRVVEGLNELTMETIMPGNDGHASFLMREAPSAEPQADNSAEEPEGEF